MNIPQHQTEALRMFGYSEEEARFLYLVATHSGYFLARQFLGFTGARWGKKVILLQNKLAANRQARTCQSQQGGTVYQLSSGEIYRQLGYENPGQRRAHEPDYILTRVAMLDFVLGHPELHYLERGSQKVEYFLKELAVAAQVLPAKSYGGRYSLKPAVRYFADCFPMFLPADSAQPRFITFTYLQAAPTNLSGFAQHLEAYLPLFRELTEFRFLFLARSPAHFAKASELFRELVAIPLEPNPSGELLRYFAIQKAWDLAQYASLSEADLIYRNLARERFRGKRFEDFYRAWSVGRVTEAEIRDALGGSDKPHSIQFATQILQAIGPARSQAMNKINTARAINAGILSPMS